MAMAAEEINIVQSQTLEYLTDLYGKATEGDIVLVNESQNKVVEVFKVNELESCSRFIDSYKKDLFIKVNLMDHSKTLKRNPFGTGGEEEVHTIVSLHLDVDASKDDRYLTREKILKVLANMPCEPTLIINSNGPEQGFHVYWLLDEPYRIESEDDRHRIALLSRNWLSELKRLADKVDSTSNLDRLLRPVGSLRKSGNRVQVYKNSHRRYKLSDFYLQQAEPVKQVEYTPRDEDSIIEKYLGSIGLSSPEAILRRHGYSHVKDGFWIRPGSTSGKPSGEVFRASNGKLGFTVKSGAADPLTNINENGTSGRWYSCEALYVAFEHRNDWKAAAKFCHEQLEPVKDPVNLDALDPKAEKPESTTSPASELLDSYVQKLMDGTVEKLTKLGSVLDGIEIGPGLLTVWGAGPGSGKTCLAMQATFEALENNPNLVVTIANAETTFEGLLRREFARITGINSRKLRFAELDDNERERIRQAQTHLRPLVARIEIVNECNLESLILLASEPPGLLIVDYLQKFAPSGDARQGVVAVMAQCRHLAKKGWAVVALSATARTQGKGGSAHNSSQLNQASYRDSGDIEFNADACYLLVDQGPVKGDELERWTQLKCVKNRHDSKEDRSLIFNMRRQRFERGVDCTSIFESDSNAFGGDDDE